MFEELAKGGIVMIPLVLCSVVGLAIILERLINLRRRRIVSPSLRDRIVARLEEHDVPGAVQECETGPRLMATVFRAGLEASRGSRDEVEKAIEDTAERELPAIERGLTGLLAVSQTSPLLGLLGTVLGMIEAFNIIAAEGGKATYDQLATGISKALITTAAGLTIAIPCVVMYYFFKARVKAYVLEMERLSVDLVERLAMRHAPDETS